MSETAREILDEAMADLYETKEDAAVFHPLSGDPVDCYISIRKDIQFATGGMQSQTWGQGTVLEYLLAETGREVVVGETFTDGTTTWTVEQILTNDGRFSKVVVV